MKLEDLKNWSLTQYNENTDFQLDYYMNEAECKIGDTAYLYPHEHNELWKMEIAHVIRRSDNPHAYDKFNKDILIEGEIKYGVDASAEFITDKDCYLVWFNFV